MHASLPILGPPCLRGSLLERPEERVEQLYSNQRLQGLEEGFPRGPGCVLLDLKCEKADLEVVLLIRRLA